MKKTWEYDIILLTELIDKAPKRVIVHNIGIATTFIQIQFPQAKFAGYKTTYKREANCSTPVKEQVGWYLTND